MKSGNDIVLAGEIGALEAIVEIIYASGDKDGVARHLEATIKILKEIRKEEKNDN